MWPQERGRCKMLTIRKIRGRELKRFKKLEGEYHYMGETRSGGDTLRLVAEEDGEWVALMVTYERLSEAIDTGALVTRARGVHWIIGKDAATGARGGFTLYIGSRSSERCVRIYDKAAERLERAGEVVAGSWMRIELEATGHYADALAREVLARGASVMIEQLNRHCRFTVPSVSDSNRWRHPFAAWWYEVIGSIEQGAPLVCGEDVPVTVDDLIDYLIRQAAPAFAAVVEATGGDMYGIAQRMLADGAHRLKPRHMVAIREAQAEAVPV